MSTHIAVMASRIPSGSPIVDFDIAVLDGRSLLVCADFSSRVFTWEPTDDQWTERPLDNPWFEEGFNFTEITAICAGVVDGRIVVGGGGIRQGFAQWDLVSGGVRTYAATTEGGMYSASSAVIGGRSLFVVGHETGIQLWDPSVAERDEPGGGEHEEVWEDEPSPFDFLIETEKLHSASSASSAVAAGMLGDQAVAVANGTDDDRVLVWNVDEKRPVTQFDEYNEELSEFALAIVDGAARVVAAGGRSITVGDPNTGAWDEPLTAPFDVISCLDVGLVSGRTVAVTGAEDGTVCVWDLADRRLLGEPLTEHHKEVFAVRVTELDGRPVAISAGRDGVVRVWALAQP